MEKYILIVVNEPKFLFKMIKFENIEQIDMKMASENPQETEKNIWIFMEDESIRINPSLFDFDKFCKFIDHSLESFFIIHAISYE